MPPKRTTPTATTTASLNSSTPTPTPQAKQKKPAVPWDKDGQDGQSSIRIILDWLGTEGNYQKWRGDTKGGATKTALATEILAEMKKNGINHRDAKGIQTKIQELQISYGKASDFLRGSGAGLLDEDIENGTTTLPAALAKRCRYWDELDPIMALRTCANPPATYDSSIPTPRPDLLASRHSDMNRDEEPDAPGSPVNHPPTSDPILDRPATSEPNTGTPIAEDGAESATPTVRVAGTKRKAISRPSETAGLDKVLADSYDFKIKSHQARERREEMKLQSQRQRDLAEAKERRTQKKFEERRLRVTEMEAQTRARRMEMEEIRARIDFMKDLKALGHSTDEIKKFLEEQFSRGEGSSIQPFTGTNSENQDSDDSSSGSDLL